MQVLVRTTDLEERRLLLDRIGYESFLDIGDASSTNKRTTANSGVLLARPGL